MSAHVFLQSARAQVGHVNVNKAIPDIGTIKQSNSNSNNNNAKGLRFNAASTWTWIRFAAGAANNKLNAKGIKLNFSLAF